MLGGHLLLLLLLLGHLLLLLLLLRGLEDEGEIFGVEGELLAGGHLRI